MPENKSNLNQSMCRQLSRSRTRQKGMLLVESMVSLAILSIALLGLSKLQLVSSKNNLSSLLKTETAISSSQIIELMRANLPEVASGNYNRALSADKNDVSSNPTQADKDINTWIATLQANASGMTPKAGINCGGITTVECTIELQWNDERGSSFKGDDESESDSDSDSVSGSESENNNSNKNFRHITNINF